MRSSHTPGLFAGALGPAPARPHGSSAASRTPRNRFVAGLSIALGLISIWAVAASWYILFHDELLTRYVAQQRSVQVAYEERVGALQLQLDRVSSERLLNRDGTEGRLLALTERQALIERRQAQLAGIAGAAIETTSSIAAPAYVAPAPPPKPFPTPDALELRMRGSDRSDASDRRVAPRLAGLEDRIERIAAQQGRALSVIADKATRSVERMRSAILQAGLEPSRFETKPDGGLGGPFVPVSGDAFDIAVTEAKRLGADEERLRRAVQALPFRKPLAEDFTYSSGFGTRLDPFTRGLAMHTGLDMRAEYGAPARATAAGRVTTADYTGGYGNMVEIDHGHGIVTRYAHLSGDTVSVGQWVEPGTIVGRVGSTGRSTGNHLHYETRIDGEPVDPQRFLRAGSPLTAPD